MPFSNAEKDEMLDATTITYAGLFNGDPFGAGTEASGGGYARLPIAFDAASGGAKVSSDPLVFSIAGGFTVSYAAFYDAIAGSLRAAADLTNEAFTNDGEYTLDSVTLTI